MKKTILLLLLTFLGFNISKAQLVPKKVFLGGYLGPSMYTGYNYNSLTFGAELGQNASKDVSMLLNAGVVLETGGKRYDITLNARSYISSETSLKFFGELGAGAYIFKSGSSYTSRSETYLGINFGLGGKIPMDNQTELVIKGKFHNVFPTGGFGLNWVNLTAGINFNL